MTKRTPMGRVSVIGSGSTYDAEAPDYLSTRRAHLAWCKQRALELLDAGDLARAVSSMTSDLMKHPETAQAAATLAPAGLVEAMMNNAAGVRHWIEGFG